MGIVIFDIKEGAPTSVHLPQAEVMATNKQGQLKHIGYYRGQNTIFVEEIGNKDLKPNKVPEFSFNPERDKCELRVNDRDIALVSYLENHPWFLNGRFEKYSEEINNQKKLGRAEDIEKALEYVRESDELKIRALGMAVLGINEAYGKTSGTVKALLKDKAIEKPLEVINACEDDLYDNRFIASLALASGIIKVNNTMTAIIWSDNQGIILNITTGEDFITKLAKHIGEKSEESRSLMQELGTRLALTKKKTEVANTQADEIARLKAQLEESKLDLEIAQNKLSKVPKVEVKEEVIESDIEILRNEYTEVTGKNVSPRFINDSEWIKNAIDKELNS